MKETHFYFHKFAVKQVNNVCASKMQCDQAER